MAIARLEPSSRASDLPLEVSLPECVFLLDSVDPADSWGDDRGAGQWLTVKLIDGLVRMLDSGLTAATVRVREPEAALLHHCMKSYSKDGRGYSMYDLWLRILRLRLEFAKDSFLHAPAFEAVTEEPAVEDIKAKLEEWKKEYEDADKNRDSSASKARGSSSPARRSRRGARAEKALRGTKKARN